MLRTLLSKNNYYCYIHLFVEFYKSMCTTLLRTLSMIKMLNGTTVCCVMPKLGFSSDKLYMFHMTLSRRTDADECGQFSRLISK